jgi:hypothetical protein
MPKLLDALESVYKGELTAKEAAQQLGITTQRVVKLYPVWGKYAPEIRDVLVELQQPARSVAERGALMEKIAEVTGTTPKTSQRFVRLCGVEIPLAQSQEVLLDEAIAAADFKNNVHRVVIQTIAGDLEPVKDTFYDGVHYRTVLRHAGQYLRRVGLTYREVKRLSPEARRTLAEKLDDKPNYEPWYRPRRLQPLPLNNNKKEEDSDNKHSPQPDEPRHVTT